MIDVRFSRRIIEFIMQKIIHLFIGLTVFTSCSASKNTITNRKAHLNNQGVQRASGYVAANYKSQTSLDYIERFKGVAIKEMNLYGIPASITLAQGLFESGAGNGELARIANNHFGIKCTFDWKGQSYYKDDDHVNDCFRVYNNPEDSFRDHSNFLKRKNYIHLFELDKNDYKGWAYGLKQAGYATNPKYPQLLLTIIEKYNLHQYDSTEGEISKIKREDRVFTQIDQNIVKTEKDSIIKKTSADKVYTVQQGDTLFNISNRFGLTVDDLKALNNIENNTIRIGQKLVLAK